MSPARNSRRVPSTSTTRAPSVVRSTAVPSTAPDGDSIRTSCPMVADRARCSSRIASTPPEASRAPSQCPKDERTGSHRLLGSIPRPAAAKDVAPGGPSSSGPGQPTLRPMPTTTTGGSPSTSSARMPATLPGRAPSTRRTSLGHLIRTVDPCPPNRSSRASTTATASVEVISGSRSGPPVGRSRTDISRLASGGASQRRSRRPRPAVWWPVTSTMPSPAVSAIAARSAFVDPVSST